MKSGYADLHIHSALSPCANDDMTPNNIVNMAILKGLEYIAVTDHNTIGNVKAVMECAKDKPLIVFPGMELETSEEIHLLCLFNNYLGALSLEKYVKNNMLQYPLDKNIFGNQLLYDENDNIIGNEKFLLGTATTISINNAFDEVEKRGGVCIPCHVERQANSLLSILGFIPEDLKFNWYEVNDIKKIDSLEEEYPSLKNRKHILSSDAHVLGNINEQKFIINPNILFKNKKNYHKC